MSSDSVMVVMDKIYQYQGQTHQFYLAAPTSMRFYNLHGILVYQWETQIVEEQGAWQEVVEL